MTDVNTFVNDLDINAIQKQWLVDILERVEDVLYSSSYSHEEKINAIKWLVKQTRLNSDE